MERSTGAIPSEPKCPATADAQKPGACLGRVWTSLGRDQGSSFDLGLNIDIPQNRLLRKPSHLEIKYTYTVGNSSTHAHGDEAVSPATSFPDSGSQFQELLIQYEYQLNKHTSLKAGYYFNHYGYNDFAIDSATPWMASTPQSIFLGDNTETPYSASVGFLTLKYQF